MGSVGWGLSLVRECPVGLSRGRPSASEGSPRGLLNAVLNTDELDRFSTPELASNETWRTTYDVTPTLLGTRLRLVFLLYKDDPSPTPTIETAYRELHLWINVSAPDAAAALALPDGADTRVRAR